MENTDNTAATDSTAITDTTDAKAATDTTDAKATTDTTDAKAATDTTDAKAATDTTDAMTGTPAVLLATSTASNHNDKSMDTSSKSLDTSAVGEGAKTSLSGSGLVHRVKSVLGLSPDPVSLSRPKQVPSSQSSSQASLQETEIPSANTNAYPNVQTDLPPTISADSMQILDKATGMASQLQDFYGFLVNGLREVDIPNTCRGKPRSKRRFKAVRNAIKKTGAWLTDPSPEAAPFRFCGPTTARFHFSTVHKRSVSPNWKNEQELPPLPTTLMKADLLQRAIYYHELDNYDVALRYACASAGAMPLPGAGNALPATPNPIAMYLLGVCLRHGWGCAQDRELSFAWLALSAAHACAYPSSMVVSSYAVQALKATSFGAMSRRGSAAPQADAHGNAKRPSLSGPAQAWNTASQQSLNEILTAVIPLPIFELGISIRQGWGVTKSVKMAACLFEIAAKLGDPDASAAYGDALGNGYGVRTDRMEAAKFFRAAAAGGVRLVGEGWIYKAKWGYPEDGIKAGM
ncbi:hypothetical protein SeMB42_g00990 [Synchytrium endobioticum]|uniref:Uncharacterized protein n=2 Tax=Synchytrium endobioticum TaxID=286115 RepID=A0A507DNC9_9FUNG|nr:hypothetical protein SeMB42_g00990 [Synchytrium endobioticum]